MQRTHSISITPTAKSLQSVHSALHCTAVYLVPIPPSVKCELSTDQATGAKVLSPRHWVL